jgi:ATP-dependent Clp protease protease subunit
VTCPPCAWVWLPPWASFFCALAGQATDIAIQAEQIIYLKRMMAERIAMHTGQPIERIEADSDRDRWFTADEALAYGFIDQVIERAVDVTEPAPA